MTEFERMDEFERAGFDKETCERLREISCEAMIDPSVLIQVIRCNQPEMHRSIRYIQLEIAWNKFKQTLWEEFEKSRIHKAIMWIIDNLDLLFERR